MTKVKMAKVVAVAARWMDRKFPKWAEGVTRTVMEGNFHIGNARVCIIGAGSGRSWTSGESDVIERYVAKRLQMKASTISGLTAATTFEPFWLVEAFKRIQGTTLHRG